MPHTPLRELKPELFLDEYETDSEDAQFDDSEEEDGEITYFRTADLVYHYCTHHCSCKFNASTGNYQKTCFVQKLKIKLQPFFIIVPYLFVEENFDDLDLDDYIPFRGK